ncbi:Receptor-type guanylate cyclase gcy [Seminavis robusta]|uniref:Receptor-type guanylate cyclase gcy n=1 Tax=Seminavis robusta TaxID=568900 RepID=A0A9N8DQ11_9STRA|nr:Receptor-type guanylate cyclase gcy [Seminavis robusta]|eukprot:Sro177_g077930.1 Receptor-type guanylate cyclase gcy (1093) ;mRNA; f:88558-92823
MTDSKHNGSATGMPHSTLATIRDDDDDDNVSLQSIESGVSGGSTHDGGEDAEEKSQENAMIGQGETMMVNRSKWIVYLVIALSAMVAGILTFYFVQESEKRWYEDEFEDLSVDIFDYTQVNINKLHEAAHSVADSWTSFGIHEEQLLYLQINQEQEQQDEQEDDEQDDEQDGNLTTTALSAKQQPQDQQPQQQLYYYKDQAPARLNANVTFPNFGLVAGNLASLSKAEILFVAPLVQETQRQGWEHYAVQHQDWIIQDLLVAQLNKDSVNGGGGGDSGSGDGDGSGDGSGDESKDGESHESEDGDNSHESEEDNDQGGEPDSEEGEGDNQGNTRRKLQEQDDNESEPDNDNDNEQDEDEPDQEGDEHDSEEGEEHGESDEEHDDSQDGQGDSSEEGGDGTSSEDHSQDGDSKDGESGDSEDDEEFEGPGRIRETIYGSNSMFEFHLPIWQTFPPPPKASTSPIMLDLLGLEWFPEVLAEIINTKTYGVSPIFTDLNTLILYQESDSADDPRMREPKSLLVQPIFDGLIEATSSVAGVVVSVIEWSDYMDVDLGGKTSGMIVDLEYVCPGTDTVRYSVAKSGRNTLDLGRDYPHDPKYDHLVQRKKLQRNNGGGSDDGSGDGSEDGSGDGNDSEDHNEDGDNDSSEDGRRRILVDDTDSEDGQDSEDGESHHHTTTTCAYYVSTHMTDLFVENHATNDAIIYTVVVCSIFILTGLVFLLYDFLVERRQNTVMKSALRSDALVSSLFPEDVRNRIYQEMDSKAKSNDDEAAWKNNNKENSGGAVAGAAVAGGGPDSSNREYDDSAAIARKYPETTIFFADLVGFTSWSSSREPTHVFQLLEALYGTFDRIASKRRVFKIETIGDCYVAASGLPKPQPDHALRMVKFANDCQTKMPLVLAGLVGSLGEDTAGLAMRIGLHSGPVTAGVLRGQKSRFQLFGDSVNTAARMESNGMKDRIHVSKATATLLVAAGKEDWVTAREDLVEAKGKGKMQTYWVKVSRRAASMTNSTSLDSSMALEGYRFDPSNRYSDDASNRYGDDPSIRFGDGNDLNDDDNDFNLDDKFQDDYEIPIAHATTMPETVAPEPVKAPFEVEV